MARSVFLASFSLAETRITNALSGIEKKLTESEQKLENLQKQLATAQEEVKKPFAQEAELVEKTAR